MKNLLAKGAERAVNTRLGLRAFRAFASRIKPENDWALVNLNRSIIRAADRYTDVPIPGQIRGFDDLSFLFSCWRGNRWLIELDFDEAAYLYRLAHSLERPTCIEIGRLRGGSTLLIAAAIRNGRLSSIDLHVALGNEAKEYDEQLRRALAALGLSDRVDVLVANSRTFDNASLQTDLLFIDGDHTYEGAKADYEHWIGTVKPGGHVVFHDDYPGKPGVYRLMRELERDPGLSVVSAPGTLAHFVKRPRSSG
jgi:hypothetical protein